ncbi:Gfo/Idh/MocA family protein [Bianquea renquensis]|uniref:Gfo/Idh/MocA family oxidoreductase n=1 Tax=Bianquea renquensis TaxID=2763661 RepID=A0A926I1E6_9FIRM|nr:Gfo/Idh/MocA family oxidoreductase [Bianquea renquensis]MBC8543378.1 Gfo/Idh/MocA family oxidoreductase [Bianquea renquensis]
MAKVKEQLKIGVVGLGGRGTSLLEAVMIPMEDISIIGVCDKYEDRRMHAAQMVKEKKGNEPLCTADYKEILALGELDALVVTTSWADHLQPAIDAMKAGKRVAMEVGGAYSLDQLWQLVHTSEETGIPCMMLENCCYGRDELMVRNMVEQGVFGEIVHCQGGYHHDLRHEISFGRENRHYRLDNYKNRNCENYPTHELGPIAKVLKINHGNRMVSLSSVASKSRGLNDYLKREKGDEYDITNYPFAQGDVVTTTIRCAHGETIVLTLDTTLPRAYSRGFHIQGTRAMYMEDNRSLFIDGVHNQYDFCWKDQWNNVEEYRDQYEHPIWKQYLAEGIKGGHDGMDWLVFRAFFESVMKDEEPPIDVYDTAAWMCISALSENSIAMGGLPVAIPDFTNGKWITR